MPAPAGNKRVKGKSVYRPFIYGTIAELLPPEPSKRPEGCPEEHTHKWTVFVKGVEGADITHWLKKVQFKLHESFVPQQRTVEAPESFEVTETGWGEFEIGIKLFFAPESGEKSQSLYHNLKLHHFGPDKEEAKARGDPVISQLYEEIEFKEPAEAFFETLTTDPGANARSKAGSKGAKAKQIKSRNAEIPETGTYSKVAEKRELDHLKGVRKMIEELIASEKAALEAGEKELAEIKAAPDGGGTTVA